MFFRVIQKLVRILVLVGVMTQWPSAYAVRAHYFDIDGTLFHDSGELDGKLPAWWMYWILVRQSDVNNGLTLSHYLNQNRDGALPDHVLVTRHEMDMGIRGALATREGRSGEVVPMELMDDPINEVASSPDLQRLGSRPRKIVPGFYLNVPSETFKYHRDLPDPTGGSDQTSSLVSSYRAAVARTNAKPRKFEWRGRGFRYFQFSVEKQGPNERVYLLSDQDRNEASVQQLLGEMHKDGFLAEPSFVGDDGKTYSPRLISMTAVSGRVFAPSSSFDSRKPEAIAQEVEKLSRSPLPQQSVLDPDLNEALKGNRRPMHEVIFYENNPDYIRTALEKFPGLAARFSNVKIILFHAGTDEQIRGAKFNVERPDMEPTRWLIFTPSAKGWRRPLPIELDELEGRAKSCEVALSGKGVSK